MGMNYYDALPIAVAAPAYPVFFTKFVSCLVGAYDPIEMPSESSAIDHVLGCTITDDVTVRDFQSSSAQWLQGKAWDPPLRWGRRSFHTRTFRPMHGSVR